MMNHYKIWVDEDQVQLLIDSLQNQSDSIMMWRRWLNLSGSSDEQIARMDDARNKIDILKELIYTSTENKPVCP